MSQRNVVNTHTHTHTLVSFTIYLQTKLNAQFTLFNQILNTSHVDKKTQMEIPVTSFNLS